MLELADVVAINKFDRRGADDAFRQVCRQWARDHRARPDGDRGRSRCSARSPPGSTTTGPPRSTSASEAELIDTGLAGRRADCCRPPTVRTSTRRARPSSRRARPLPGRDRRDGPRLPRRPRARLAAEARQAQQIGAVVALGGRPAGWTGRRAVAELAAELDAARDPRGPSASSTSGTRLRADLRRRRRAAPGPTGTTSSPALWRTSLSGTRIPRVALPRVTEHGELLRWLRSEHLPGHFPFTAGVFPFKRDRARTRPACSPARATPSAPTAASTCWPRASRPPASPRRSTR